MSLAAKKGTKLNVHTFPRPPALESVSNRHLRVEYQGKVIAETDKAYWVLETTHPPTYYIPQSDIDMTLFSQTDRSSYCEWKGYATYWSVKLANQQVMNRCWSYGKPTKPFAAVKDYISFYVGPWDCFVDGEKVEAQPGDF
ncbi:Predicted protein [Taphrina deformans PYCC 5710]|uniref:DUF427 domain-containing protein n=1 Tax=Taphrina deformans (strain PYCC 5710 / ATCC 11124 / CBS 356.35 / IMI 108563 / JCM 9778 / NBRC 8474) TaxID=1097556 RepID=R4X863_TAPDE|nr:Predicted protein [Taphrina deformans PYCC 5710]|eukprot:CCG81683.1 Predicted protein [Taphrina deformans PYCC 5710]